ncbi:S-norcoclaurine synthase 2-like protein [Tanacetum coccineum]
MVAPVTLLRSPLRLMLAYFITRRSLLRSITRIWSKNPKLWKADFLISIGFNFYKYKLEIKDNPNGQSCLLKYKVEYDIKEEFAANASLITMEPFIALTNIASEHLLKSN